MSDFLLGAIVGGGFSLLVSVVTLLIQGHFSKNTAKMQIDAQAKEAWVNRLAGVRSQYLNPLREQVARVYEQLIEISDQMIVINIIYGDPPAPTNKQLAKYKREVTKLKKAVDRLASEHQKCDIIRSKTSDHELTKLFYELSDNLYKLNHDVLLLRGIPAEWIPKSGAKKYKYGKAADNVLLFQSILEDINGRIEQLLSGGELGK